MTNCHDTGHTGKSGSKQDIWQPNNGNNGIAGIATNKKFVRDSAVINKCRMTTSRYL